VNRAMNNVTLTGAVQRDTGLTHTDNIDTKNFFCDESILSSYDWDSANMHTWNRLAACS